MTKCRYCGASIFFRLTDKGRWQPVSRDTGEPHFADCGPYVAARKQEASA